MDWDNLKIFLALAETGSLSRAAAQHRVDHSTIARRIGRFEREWGVRLVGGLARPSRLTPEGELVRDRLHKVEAGIAEIARAVRGGDLSPGRVVRVSGPPTLVSRFLAPRLLPLQARHLGLRIELVGEDRQVSLARGEADLALRLVRPNQKDVVAKKLGILAYGLY